MKFLISLFSAFSRAHTAAPSGCPNLFSFLKQSSSHILWEKSKKSWKNRYTLAQKLVQSWPSGVLFLSKMWFLNLSLLGYVWRLTNKTFSGRNYGHISFNSGQKIFGRSVHKAPNRALKNDPKKLKNAQNGHFRSDFETFFGTNLHHLAWGVFW